MNEMVNPDTDALEFADEDALPQQEAFLPLWKILVIDDDHGVHDVTRVVLRGFKFEGSGLALFHAYSGQEGKELLAQHPDAAILLLDVSMESEHAGLDLVKHIREVLNNHTVRIVLRTGQPGSAPEEAVISRYDINDYKEKTELTARKMSTLMFACLRGFRDLMRLENNKRGLMQIIQSSSDLYRYSSLDLLSSGVLGQLDSLLNLRGTLLAGSEKGSMAAVLDSQKNLNIIAGTGAYSNSVGNLVTTALPLDASEILNNFMDGADQRKVASWDDKLLGLFRNASGEARVVFISGFIPKTDFDIDLVNLYLGNVGDSIENLMLREEIEETQRELVYRLGGAVETRSRETGQHVKRVAEMSYRLALLTGLSHREATLIKCASPMHDVGKIGIPDAILGKPAKLDDQEWETMKRHPVIGYDLLQGSQREILAMSAVIALEHHEKWDGSGYPFGKRENEIHLAARITSIVDVFDALGSRRSYKKEWDIADIVREVKEQSGLHFDPLLVDLLLGHIDEFVAVRARYSD
jgi:response regulator RpfG family c-di-GMP phosphodiesterase